MACPQCQVPTDVAGDGEIAVGWCGRDVHVACLPLHVRACRSCWPHNTAYILLDDQRRTAEAAVGR